MYSTGRRPVSSLIAKSLPAPAMSERRFPRRRAESGNGIGEKFQPKSHIKSNNDTRSVEVIKTDLTTAFLFLFPFGSS